MKKIMLVLITLVMATRVFAIDDGYVEDMDYLVRAVAASYPDADIAELTGIAAVVYNRCSAEGFPNTAAGVVSSFGGGEFLAPVVFRDGEKLDKTLKKQLRIAYDACRFAKNGADPTGGSLNFCRLCDEKKLDFLFDDSAEDQTSDENRRIIENSRAVIGKFAFW